jgi:hypothetical protein
MKAEIPIRITLVAPPAGVLYALQRGKDERVSPVRSEGSDLVFSLTLTLAGRLESGFPRFTGAFAQGPADQRFVYIRIGVPACDLSSPWSRRAKIHLSGITWEMVEEVQATPKAVIAARFAGKDKKGEPACASIWPLEEGWKVAG